MVALKLFERLFFWYRIRETRIECILFSCHTSSCRPRKNLLYYARDKKYDDITK